MDQRSSGSLRFRRCRGGLCRLDCLARSSPARGCFNPRRDGSLTPRRLNVKRAAAPQALAFACVKPKSRLRSAYDDKRGRRVNLLASSSRTPCFLQPGRVRTTAGDFFIWICRNPLKSRESAKGIQGNPSSFPWIPLVLLGFPWSEFARQVVSVGSRLTVLSRPGAPERPRRWGDRQLDVRPARFNIFEELTCAFFPRETHGMFARLLARQSQRLDAGRPQVLVEHAGARPYDIDRPGHGISSHR